MPRNEELPAELKAFEAELASLVPEDERLDRARLLFAAGRASARVRSRVVARAWAAAAGAMTVVAASLLVALLVRPEPPVKIVEQIASAKDGVAGTKQSGVPEDPGVVEAKRSGIPDYPLRYPMPEEPSVLAAVFFGAPDHLASPLRLSRDYPGLRDWTLHEGFDRGPRPTVHRQATTPKPPEPKSYRELLNEWVKTNG